MEIGFTPKELRTFARIMNKLDKLGVSPYKLRDDVLEKINKDVIPAEVILNRWERKKWLAEIPAILRDSMKDKVREARRANLAQTKSGRRHP